MLARKNGTGHTSSSNALQLFYDCSLWHLAWILSDEDPVISDMRATRVRRTSDMAILSLFFQNLFCNVSVSVTMLYIVGTLLYLPMAVFQGVVAFW